MPAPTLISLTAPSLPIGYCFTTWQQLAIDLFTGAFATIPGSLGIGFNYGSAIPDVNSQSKPWLRLNADGSLNGVFSFAFGTWVRPYAIPAGPNDYRAIWVGTLADLYSFDGGDGVDPNVTPPSQAAGSFWQEDTNFAARTIVGAGTLPVAGTILLVGDTGGLDQVTLSIAELATHTHQSVASGQVGKPSNTLWGASGDGTATGTVYPNNHGLASIGTSEVPIASELEQTGADEPHENMPPFYTAYIIRRTGRSHYTI